MIQKKVNKFNLIANSAEDVEKEILLIYSQT
jgi:hypothetical protein